jgi:hypothetical protein
MLMLGPKLGVSLEFPVSYSGQETYHLIPAMALQDTPSSTERTTPKLAERIAHKCIQGFNSPLAHPYSSIPLNWKH